MSAIFFNLPIGDSNVGAGRADNLMDEWIMLTKKFPQQKQAKSAKMRSQHIVTYHVASQIFVIG